MLVFRMLCRITWFTFGVMQFSICFKNQIYCMFCFLKPLQVLWWVYTNDRAFCLCLVIPVWGLFCSSFLFNGHHELFWTCECGEQLHVVNHKSCLVTSQYALCFCCMFKAILSFGFVGLIVFFGDITVTKALTVGYYVIL